MTVMRRSSPNRIESCRVGVALTDRRYQPRPESVPAPSPLRSVPKLASPSHAGQACELRPVHW